MEQTRRRLAVSLAAGLAAVAGSFGVAGRTPEFVAAPVSGLLVDLAPGALMTVAIQTLGDWGHRLVLGAALVLTAGLFALVALAAVLAGARSTVPYTAAFAALAGGWVLGMVLTAAPTAAAAAAVPLALVLVVAERGWSVGRERDRRARSRSRRDVLAAVGALAGFVGLAGSRGWSRTGVERGDLESVTDAETQAEADELLESGREQSLAVGDLPGLVTPNSEFYEVDVNNVNPNPSDGRWSLSVTGAVEQAVSVDFTDLTETTDSGESTGTTDAVEHRFGTLRCVGEPLNGQKMDTALWTGVPVGSLLDRAGVSLDSECCVMVRAVDGYFEEFPLAALEDAMLAFGMNGERLPRGHGYPVRLLVPGHWGEIDVKWVTEIEVLTEEKQGYWEQRGWHGTGPVNTVAKLHAVEHRPDGSIRVGGHAYAGTRGIQRVEVSTDGGETWSDAELSAELPGPDVWRQWRYEYDPPAGEHEVVVRATDGEGERQPREFSQPYPSGPTGWVSRSVEP